MKEYKITLNLEQSTKNSAIYLKNDDVDSIKFTFEVKQDEEIYDLTDTTSVRLAVKKPNNVVLYQECSIVDGANGICEVILITQAYDLSGLYLGELYINKGGQMLVTRQFEYTSLVSILAEGTTETGTTGPVYWTDVLNKPLDFPPSAHGHDWGEISNKPLTYPTSAHMHEITDVTGLTDALNSKLEAIPAEYLTETEGDGRYAPIGATGGIEPPRTGTVDPSGAPDYVGQTYINTTTGEAWIATTAIGGWQTISMDELGGGDSSVSWASVTDKPATFPPSAHDHVWADITDAPTEMTPTTHTHDWTTDVTGKPTAYPPDTHTHPWGEVTDKPLTFTPEAHGHAIGDITNLTTTLQGKSDTGHTHSYTELTNVPTTFTPATHAHAITDITNLDTTLQGKSDAGHTHSYTELTDVPTTFTPEAHSHPEITETILSGLSLWKGTQLEYDNIITKDPNTLYFIVG